MHTNSPQLSTEVTQPKRYIRAKAVCAKLSISKATLYDWVSKGLIPRPLKLGATSFWIESDLEAAVEGREAA